MIVTSDMYAHKLVNSDEKRIKIYLRKGVIGNLTKVNHHAAVTRFVPIEFRPEFYHESFDNLTLDRYHLNSIQSNSRQQIPDEYIQMEYAYALTPSLARLSHWDKVTMITDSNIEADDNIQKCMLYTAITRAKQSLTIVV